MELIKGRAALLVIDMQNDFCDPSVGTYAPGAREIIEPIASLIECARRTETPVIFTQEIHRPDHLDAGRERDPGAGLPYPGGATDDPLPVHCVAGTTGAEIIDELEPRSEDVRISKRRYSCFLGTDLQLLLNGLDVQTLLITGVCSNICVLWTAGDAYQLDYHVRVIEDCIAGTSLEEHEAALTIMRPLTFPERPVLSDEVVAAVRESRAPAAA
jgi:nicotinamidase-related amidase